MLVLRAVRAAAAACLLLGCSRTATPKMAQAPKAFTPEYVVISPDVSLSRTAQPAEMKPVQLDEHADVMAEILAIPPGR
jgi:hypothetical protein